MFFLAGAASSVLDILGSLRQASGAQSGSAASATTPNQTPFNIPAPSTGDAGENFGPTAAGAGPTGAAGGYWSSADTMSALLSAQSQSTTATTGDPTNTDLAGAAMQGGPLGVRHAGGIAQLLQALGAQSGTDQDVAGTDGSTGSSDGATVMPSGFSFPISPPFLDSANSSAASTGSTSTGLDLLPANPLERLINAQAQLFAAATAGQNLSRTA